MHDQLKWDSKQSSRSTPSQPPVIGIAGEAEQLFDTIAHDRRDDPELGQMGTNSINRRGLLANEQVTGTMQRHAALASW